MKRYIEDKLMRWFNKDDKKPLLLTGPRQVGKTYSLRFFIKNNFKNNLELNLLTNSSDLKLVEDSENIDEFLTNLKILHKFEVNNNSILFIDEIQESQKALNLLKSLNEKKDLMNNVVASGSWIENTLFNKKMTFPVGQVDMLFMAPLSFFEFLVNSQGEDIVQLIHKKYIDKTTITDVIHNKLLFLYKEYLFVGGMPAILKKHLDSKKYITSEEIVEDKKMLISQYKIDLSKYVSGIQAVKINKLIDSIPQQLSNDYNRFIYSKVSKNGQGRDYLDALGVLELSKLTIPVYKVNEPKHTLKINQDRNQFKIYFMDVGLLSSLGGVSYKVIFEDNFSKKGYIAENYVAIQLFKKYQDLSYWKVNNDYEVDFLISNDEVIPIEVKSGKSRQTKSLKKYIEKYKPRKSYIISKNNFHFSKNQEVIPLYAIELLTTNIKK